MPRQNDASTRGESGEDRIATAFERTVDEGKVRLGRSWPALLATGVVGGLDVSMGLLGFFVVKAATGNELLAALAFSIGFIALTLANSELFTENFLVPIAAVAAGKAPVMSIVRLWVGTAVMNLLGGWVLMGFVVAGLPTVRHAAVEAGGHYIGLGITFEGFSAAVLGGMVITLMTWMDHSTESVTGKLVAVISAAFLLAAAPLNHAIVMSLSVFAALHVGAPFGYLDWLGTFGWAVLGNIVGGIGLVTVLRLVQVGKEKLDEERNRPS